MGYALANSQFSGTQGISTGSSSTTLNDTSQAWTVNQWRGFTVQSYSAGFPTRGTVASNTATILTLDSTGWDNGTPAANSVYMVSNLQKQIGQTYHCGFANGSQWYGYMLEPSTSKDGGYRERSDITAKQQLIQYSSPNVIDRDFVYWPRVSQGDVSGGMGQPVFINPNQYWDSDLLVDNAGYLRLPLQWIRSSTITLAAGTGSGQCTFLPSQGNPYYFTFQESNGHFYQAQSNLGTVTTFTTSGAITASFMDSDGQYIYIASTGAIDRYNPDGSLKDHVATAVNGTISQFWVVEQGTNGFVVYYANTINQLWKIDLTLALPVASHVQVPLGGNPLGLVDLCQYQTGVALVTKDINGQGSDVWYFDGANLTRIVRLEAFMAAGLCNCLGNLYVSATTGASNRAPALLIQISSGSFTVVASLINPSGLSSGSTVGQPRAAGSIVFWPLFNGPIGTLETSYWARYNTLTGALSHLPSGGASEFGVSKIRGFIPTDEFGLFTLIFVNATNGAAQVASANNGGTQGSGKLVTSRFDFGTPGIEKRFRRLEVIHAPLPTNTTLKIDAFIDKDPVAYTAALTPDATITNSKLNSVATDFFLANLIGHSAYFVFTLSTSDNSNTPVINWFSIEVTTPRAWELDLNCTKNRTLLGTTDPDTQGVRAKDLADFWPDAWTNPRRLTFFGRDGYAYVVSLESYDRWNPSPQVSTDNQRPQDEEYIVHVVLRETLADS